MYPDLTTSWPRVRGIRTCYRVQRHAIWAGHATSKEGTRCCPSSTVTFVISRNASGTAGQGTVHQLSQGPPYLGGIVSHKSG